MKMVRAVVRPERAPIVLEELSREGFSAATEMDVYGRGKQKGITVGSVFYDELPKSMLIIIIDDKDEDKVCKIIMDNARTGLNGNIGDGRIFVLPVEKAYTISTGAEGL